MKREYRESPEERLIMDSDKVQAVKDMIRRIIETPGRRVTTLIEIMEEIKEMKEPEFSDQMSILRLAVARGFLHVDLKEAIIVMDIRKRGTTK